MDALYHKPENRGDKMALMASDKGGEGFDPAPEGAHIARCVTVVDMGLQETTWQGNTSYKEKVYIAFEIPSVRVTWKKDGNEMEGPALIGSTYTLSISDRAILGQHLVNWRGRAFTQEERAGFDLFTILDKPCQVSITHKESNGKTYANITGVMGLPAGMQAPARETELLAYTPQDSEKAGNLDKLPKWLREKCEAGHRLNQQPNGAGQLNQDAAAAGLTQPPMTPGAAPPPLPPEFEDDIPF